MHDTATTSASVCADTDAVAKKLGKPYFASASTTQEGHPSCTSNSIRSSSRHGDLTLVKEYFDTGQARRDRIRVMLRFAALCIFILVLVIIIWKYFPDLLDLLSDHGDDLKKARTDIRAMLVCFFVSTIYFTIPLPGRAIWQVFVGFVYGWWGFSFLICGHLVGSLVAFTGARTVWKKWLSSNTVSCLFFCCCCFLGKKGSPSKMILLLMGCMAAIEERPFRMIFLIGLTPIPSAVTALLVGAKSNSISCLTFLVPNSCSAFKLLLHIYIGSQVTDVADVVSGSSDPASTVMTIAGIVFGVFLFFAIARYAMLMLRQAQDQLADVARAASENSGNGENHSDGTRTPCRSVGSASANDSLGELSRKLFEEYAGHRTNLADSTSTQNGTDCRHETKQLSQKELDEKELEYSERKLPRKFKL